MRGGTIPPVLAIGTRWTAPQEVLLCRGCLVLPLSRLHRVSNLQSLDVLLLDFSYASWINLTLSGARGKMNSSIDTVVTFPHLTRTNRSFSVTNYTRISKYQRPQDGIIEQRRNSAHYELQKAVPVQSNEATSDLQSPSQFQPGFLVLVGQRGQSAIDSDFIARLTPRWRVKCCTNASSRRKLNDVRPSIHSLPCALLSASRRLTFLFLQGGVLRRAGFAGSKRRVRLFHSKRTLRPPR